MTQRSAVPNGCAVSRMALFRSLTCTTTRRSAQIPDKARNESARIVMKRLTELGLQKAWQAAHESPAAWEAAGFARGAGDGPVT